MRTYFLPWRAAAEANDASSWVHGSDGDPISRTRILQGYSSEKQTIQNRITVGGINNERRGGQRTLQSLVCRSPRQSPHPLCVPSPPLDIQIDTRRVFPASEQVRPWCDCVTSQLPLWDHDGVPPHPILIGLPCSCENNVQLLLSLTTHSVVGGGSRNDSIPVASRTFDDRSGPSADQVVSLSPNVGRDAFAFCIEKDDATETGLFQNVGVDEVHFAEDGEEFALNIKGRE